MVRGERDRTHGTLRSRCCYLSVALTKSAGTPESVQLLLVGVFGEASNCSDETPAPIADRAGLGQSFETVAPSGAELKVRIHSPPAESCVRTTLVFIMVIRRGRPHCCSISRNAAQGSQIQPWLNLAFVGVIGDGVAFLYVSWEAAEAASHGSDHAAIELWPRRGSPGGTHTLGRKQGLAIHSGAIGDGIADLMEAGIVDNQHKEIDPAVTVATMMGTSRLYRFADRNPAI